MMSDTSETTMKSPNPVDVGDELVDERTEIRTQINKIDTTMIEQLIERFMLSERMGVWKAKTGTPVYAAVFECLPKLPYFAPESFKKHCLILYRAMWAVSRRVQYEQKKIALEDRFESKMIEVKVPMGQPAQELLAMMSTYNLFPTSVVKEGAFHKVGLTLTSETGIYFMEDCRAHRWVVTELTSD